MFRKHAIGALCAVALSATAVCAGALADGMEAYRSGDFEGAAKLWVPLARAGDPLAQFNMGILHDLGQGVDRDAAAAAEWFRRAAEAGDPIAAYNLGMMLAAGRGVEADPAAAAAWFSFAAERGHTAAMLSLSVLYANGRGVARDLSEALRLDELARETECLLERAEHNHQVRSTPLPTMAGG